MNMLVVNMIGIILLAVFLIFWGLVVLFGVSLPSMVASIVAIIGIASGVLLLISIGTHRHHQP
jgi:hypothetical protein